MTAYNLRRPCPKCPFRIDVPPYLHGERAEEIADQLRAGAEFYCHQTVNYDTEREDEDGYEIPDTTKSTFCAGALIVMEKMEEPNQMMRIAERIGLYDHTKLDMDAPVHDDLDGFVEHHHDH